MNLTEKEVIYISHIVALMSDKDNYNSSPSKQDQIVKDFKKLVIPIARALPEGMVADQLDSNRYLLRNAAQEYLLTQLKEEAYEMLVSEEDILNEIDDFTLNQMADDFYYLAEVILSVSPKLPLMHEMIAWEEENLDEEVKKLVEES